MPEQRDLPRTARRRGRLLGHVHTSVIVQGNQESRIIHPICALLTRNSITCACGQGYECECPVSPNFPVQPHGTHAVFEGQHGRIDLSSSNSYKCDTTSFTSTTYFRLHVLLPSDNHSIRYKPADESLYEAGHIDFKFYLWHAMNRVANILLYALIMPPDNAT
jgi:hypothetical protein